MSDFWYDSDVMPVPDIPVPYVCAVEREKPPERRTTFWITVLNLREVNEIQEQAANARRDAGPGGLDISALHARQYQLLRDRLSRIDNYPDASGKRRTISDPAEKMQTFERMAQEIFMELMGAVQSWSSAREGILGNADFARSGASQTKESGTDSETANGARTKV